MTCILLNCIVKKLKNELAVRKLQNIALKWFNKHWLKFTGITPKKLHIPTSTMNVSIKKVITPIKKVLIHLNILSLLIIFACGSDTVNNVTNPPVSNNDSLKASIDSLTLYVNGLNTNDTNLYNIFSVGDSIKVTGTAETNCTSNDTAFVFVNVGNIIASLNNSNISNPFTFYGAFVSSSNPVAFMLYLKTTSLRYLKLKHIRLYRVNTV